MSHTLDDCYNDGAMWRASVNPSAITGKFLEFLIPLDEENYEEGDLIPENHKETFDLYLENESTLKPAVAKMLCGWSASHGHPAGTVSPEYPDELFAKFNFFHVVIPEDLPPDARIAELVFSMKGVKEDVPEIVADLKRGELRFAR